MKETKTPNLIDIAVGARVKAARLSRGVSQSSLADRLGLTFQQVQKYERGANRISASKLVQIAQGLSLDPAVFFEGLGKGLAKEVDFSMFSAPNVMELVVAYARLPVREQRAILHLTQELGGVLPPQDKSGED